MFSNNISLLRLNNRYEREKRKIQDVLKKKFYMDRAYIRDYKKVLNISSDDELNYSIYGSSLNPQKFKDEILSRMIYNLVMY